MRLASATLAMESVTAPPDGAGEEEAAAAAEPAADLLVWPSALEQAAEAIETAAMTASPLTSDGRIP